jgi:hypothetical protein
MSRVELETEWRFDDDAVTTVSRQGDREIKGERPRPDDDWLMPAAARHHWLAQRERGATRIVFKVLDPEQGLEPVEVRSELVSEDDEIVRRGRAIPVSTWHTTMSNLPGVRVTEMVSSDGYLVRDEVTLPFGTMTSRLADRDEALAALEGAAPELMMETFVRVDRRVERPRAAERATFRVRSRDGELPDLPSAGAQRADRSASDGSILVTLDVADPLPASAEELDDEAFIDGSMMVDKDHPLVRKLAARAARGAGHDPAARAEALRRFVEGYITRKGLETAFASASETARLRRGDCAEHAVLLCALLRADGMPARVATGLVYAEEFLGQRDIFGWHMWTQALIDGRWIDLDATLPVSFDAMHLLTSTSSLAEGALTADLGVMLALLGNMRIEVVDVGYEAPVGAAGGR